MLLRREVGKSPEGVFMEWVVGLGGGSWPPPPPYRCSRGKPPCAEGDTGNYRSSSGAWSEIFLADVPGVNPAGGCLERLFGERGACRGC